MRQAVAVRAHEIPERPPVRLSIGQRVRVGERDLSTWPEFVFVTADSGSGWVPARYLSADVGEAMVQMAYDTTELPTRAGDVLDVIEEDLRSGWLWCRSMSGDEGWVPVNTLEDAAGSARPT